MIAWVQTMLTSVFGAVVPLTQLQFDLYSFLLTLAGMEPVAGGLGGIDGAGQSAAADASVASQLRLVLQLAGFPGVPSAGNTTGAATLGGIAASIFSAMSEVGRASSLPGMAPPPPNGAIPMGVRSFSACLRRTPASRFTVGAGRCRSARRRWACDHYSGRGARGIPPGQSRWRITHRGHRALRPSGAPGIVRPGSLVVVRPRALRVVRPGA